MINYYLRPGNVYVRINESTKEIVNILNHPEQKTISKLTGTDYYNFIMTQINSYTSSDKATFDEAYNTVLSQLNNL